MQAHEVISFLFVDIINLQEDVHSTFLDDIFVISKLHYGSTEKSSHATANFEVDNSSWAWHALEQLPYLNGHITS